jgi:protein SCO1/2
MKSTYTFACAVIFLFISMVSCGPETIVDLGNESFSLLDTDSTEVQFPDAYKGKTTVISFIYTHCPDVCPAITANMKNIQAELDDTTNIRFVELTFDPKRDTPSTLAKYKKLYDLNDQFSLLTGSASEVDSLLNRLNIVAEKTQIDSLQQDSSDYFMNHSNTIYLMDKQGRIRTEYPANVVPPEHVSEDLQKIR